MKKSMDIRKFIYLKNAAGEDNVVNYPNEVRLWYDNLDTDNCTWLMYLSEYEGEYGVLAIEEILHPESETWGEEDRNPELLPWQNMKTKDIEEHLNGVVNEISSTLKNQSVMLGLYSGCWAQHEIGIWFPMKSNDNYSICRALNTIKDIGIYQ